MFPGLVDSSMKIVLAYAGHPDASTNLNKVRKLEKEWVQAGPLQLPHEMVQRCTSTSMACTIKEEYVTEAALVEHRVDFMMKWPAYKDDDDSGCEMDAYRAGKYAGLGTEEVKIAMKKDNLERRRAPVRKLARDFVKRETIDIKTREAANRTSMRCEGVYDMYVVEVDDREIEETARLIAPLAATFNLVIGGAAAEKVANAAGVEGLICPSVASTSIVKAVPTECWSTLCRPSSGKSWLDTIGTALQAARTASKLTPRDNRLLLGHYTQAKVSRGVKRERE
jgi:hypothetical protein